MSQKLIIITGMSGAGKSVALKTLEDLGFETIDNLPLSVVSLVVISSQEKQENLLAIGIDIRNRDFDPNFLVHHILAPIRARNVEANVLFLDCDDEVLQRRFNETRRRHPIAEDRLVLDGIRRERELIEPLREYADAVLDTSDFSVKDLRQWVKEHYGSESKPSLKIHLVSFSYRMGLPRDADMVFDVRFLKNPFYVEALKDKTGEDANVRAYIHEDPAYAPFMSKLEELLKFLLPRYQEEGKSYVTIAIGCTGGRHRSVCVVKQLHEWLKQEGLKPTLSFRALKSGY